MLAILNENTNGLFEKGRLISGGSNWISSFEAHGLACQERTRNRGLIAPRENHPLSSLLLIKIDYYH
jgi:hypothetical protein